MWEFLQTVFRAAKNKVVGFIKGVGKHGETILILTLSGVGLNVLLGELPFYFVLPMWVEASMVIPVLSVMGVAALVKIAEVRHS